MWTDATRRKHARKGLRYSSDLTDAEWAVLEPLLPAVSRLGLPPKWPRRTLLNGMLYILRSGQPWRMLPGDLPPVSSVQRYLYAWRDSGPCGDDAGKKFKGRKRHILTDTGGLLVAALFHTADVQDRDGAPDVLASIRASLPWLRHVFADGASAGPRLTSTPES